MCPTTARNLTSEEGTTDARELTTLRIPADGGRPCEVTTVRATPER